MPQKLILATSQARTLSTTAETLKALEATVHGARRQHRVDLILFPEAYLGGYPRTCSFGASIGARTAEGREQFLQYFHAAVDLGDTPEGADDDWILRKLPTAKGKDYRGDGTRETLERIARETSVFIVTGVVERSGGSLYCAVLFVDPNEGVVGKRRKVMPTGAERMIWAQGSPKTLRCVVAEIRGVRIVIGAAICWESYMALLRQSLYQQNINLFLAPTADARDTWAPLMQTVGAEGRCFVLSANQCQRRGHLPEWIRGNTVREGDGASIGNDQYTKTTARRRSSVVAKTEYGHEIAIKSDSAIEDDYDQDGTGNINGAASENAFPNPADNEFVSRGGSCIVGPQG